LKVEKSLRLAWLAFPLSKIAYYLVAEYRISEPRGTMAGAAILAIAGVSCAAASAVAAILMRVRGRSERERGSWILCATCLSLAELSSLSGFALSIVTAEIGNYRKMLFAATAAWFLAYPRADRVRRWTGGCGPEVPAG